MRQNYSLATLQKILDQFPNIGTIEENHLFTSGFENSNYYVKTRQGEFVIKIFEGVDISSENIFFEIEIMDKLFNAGIKSPKIFRTRKNNLYAKFDKKYAIVMAYIAGENLEKHTISDSLTKKIGEQAGKMDSVLQPIRDGSKTRQNYEFDLKNFLILEPKINQLDTKFDKKIFNEIFASFKKIKPSLDNAPAGLIQNDIVLHNILATGDELKGIIDFSDIVFSPYIQNVAVALCQSFFTYNWQPHQANIFLKSYKKFHSLSIRELKLLHTLILARFATLIVGFNHLNISFGDDFQRTEFINDNYAFLKKFLQIKKTEFQKLIS